MGVNGVAPHRLGVEHKPMIEALRNALEDDPSGSGDLGPDPVSG